MIWNKLATKYDRLWVQKYSLGPTRQKVSEIIKRYHTHPETLLDLGCGTGQMLEELSKTYPSAQLFGIDKSEKMIEIAQSKGLSVRFGVRDIDTDPLGEFEGPFDLIICSHSFPYYKNKPLVLAKVSKMLKPEGIAIFTQASMNTGYDRFVMGLIEKTAESADYLSRSDFQKRVAPYFQIIEQYTLREKFYMPSICGFVMRKKG